MYDNEFSRPLDNVGLVDLTKNLLYYRGLNDKLDKEVGDFLSERTNFPKDYSNDLRHQYVSALYARNLGNEWAKKLGDWQEVLGFQSGRGDTEIDKFNNELGRQYGAKYSTTPREQLLEKLMEDFYDNKKLRKSKLGQ
jgi:hypothetical protein